MADNVAITAGSGTTIAADEVTDGTLGSVKVQYVKLMDGTLDSTTKATVNSTGLKVDASGAAVPVTDNSGSLTVDNAGTFATQATIAAAATNIAKAEDAASADADVGVPAMAVRKATPANTSGTDGDYEMLQMSAGRLWTNALLGDGTNAVAVKAASTAPGATDPALVVAISPNSVNANGSATSANSAPVVIASDQGWPVGTTGFMKKEDVASADGDAGIPAMAIQQSTPADTAGTNADYSMLQMSGGYLWVHDNKGLANKAFVAAFTTLTRPANTTAYTAADSISDNATAGSVTALSATISDVNDDPIFISDIIVNSTDTGLAGKKIRAYLFNADPTASSGVVAGDNVAYSQKKNGYIGSFMGWMETGFSDGTVGRLVPTFNETNYTQAGGFIVCKPTSGAKTLYIQYQAVEAFTPSANSTTIIGTARGWQGRAA